MKRGRKTAGVEVVNINGDPPRLVAPDYLATDEQELFGEIVSSCSARHFVPSDLPLLATFCQASLLARRAIADDVQVWERACRIQATLATRLRLSPQSRVDPKTLARAQKSTLRKPWEC